MRKNSTFKRADSKSEVQPSAKSNQRGTLLSARMDFLQLEDKDTEDDRLKERRKKRKNRRSVNNEENSDPEDESPTDDYKVEVMRRLMKRFSLDDTVAYYRSLNSAEYAINPNNFSLDSSLHAKQLRKRLKHLLGSEVVKVNDKAFMEHVETKITEEKQMTMARREEERVEMERQRLRRLMSEGHISAREMRLGKLMQDEWKERKRSSRKSRSSNLSYSKSKSKQKCTARRTKSVNPCGINSKYQDSDEGEPEKIVIKYKTPRATYRTHSEMRNSLCNSSSLYKVESQMSRMSRKEGTSTDSGICDSTDYLHLLFSPEPHQSVMTDSGVNNESSRMTHRERKFQHPVLVKFRNEESAKGMYRLAEKILPEDRPRSYFDQKKPGRFDKRQ